MPCKNFGSFAAFCFFAQAPPADASFNCLELEGRGSPRIDLRHQNGLEFAVWRRLNWCLERSTWAAFIEGW